MSRVVIGCHVAVQCSHWSAVCLLHLPVVGGLIFCISATPHLGISFPLFHVYCTVLYCTVLTPAGVLLLLEAVAVERAEVVEGEEAALDWAEAEWPGVAEADTPPALTANTQGTRVTKGSKISKFSKS